MRISVTKCFSSGLSKQPGENGASFIDIEDNPIFIGGQGKIYEATYIDNKQVSGLLVKSFNKFPSNVKEIITIVRDNKDKDKIDQCIALRALPLFLFEGTLNNQPFYGHVMRRVDGESFNEIFENCFDAYTDLSLEDRLQLCLQFVEGMNILYNLTVVHADMNGYHLIIDMKYKKLAIIDMDGGAVAKTGSTPVVVGKIDAGWLAPEIHSQLSGNRQNRTINVNISTDLWSIACGVHHLLFGLAPFFFIGNQPEIEDYLRNHKWPQIKGIKGIKIIMANAFRYYEQAFTTVPELHKLFKVSFNDGYSNPDRRISAAQWMIEIKKRLNSIASGLPKLEISKQNFEFLNKPINSTFSGGFTITNTGAGTITGSIKTSTKSNRDWLKVSQSNIVAQPKQGIKFEINTSGLDSGFKDTGIIEIQSNAGTESVLVNLSVEDKALPKLEISKQSFDFLNIPTNKIFSDKFTIINAGTGTLSGKIKTTTKSNRNWLKVSQSNIGNQPRQDIRLDIDTSGLYSGFKDTGIIEIQSNAGTKSVLVNLSAEEKALPKGISVNLPSEEKAAPFTFYCDKCKKKTEHRIYTSKGKLTVTCIECYTVLEGKEPINYRYHTESYASCKCVDFETYHLVYITPKNHPACFCTNCGKTIIGQSSFKKICGWIKCDQCMKNMSVLNYIDEENNDHHLCSFCETDKIKGEVRDCIRSKTIAKR